MALSFVDTLFLKKQQCGPILNVTVAVLASKGSNDKTDKKDNLNTETISVDEKIEFFFKFGWITIKGGISLDTYISMRKKKIMEHAAVEVTITCKELEPHHYVKCTNTQTEIPLGNIGWTFKKDIGSSYVNFYILDITIIVKEESKLRDNMLYEDTEFTDFQLCASDGSVAVHKAMLSVHSDMFKTMLRGDWKETAEGHITMDGVTVQTLQHLKDYMYLGTLPDEGLEPLLLLAEHYLMDKLKADCITKLVTSVTPDNFEGILQFACQGSALTELVRALIYKVPDDVINAVQKLKICELKDKN